MEQNRNNNPLKEKFDNIGDSFYDMTPYINNFPGISIKKKIGDNENASMISIRITNKKYKDDDNKKIIDIRVTYGKDSENGITIRGKYKVTEPVDLESTNDYYFDLITEKFYLNRKDKEIKPLELLNEIYNQHIKPTKSSKGLYLRLKLLFWKIIIKQSLYYISKSFSFLYLIITGDKYEYTPIFGIEKINDRIVNSSMPDFIEKNIETDEKTKVKFIGFTVSKYLITSYSIIHLIIFFLLYITNVKPLFITTIFKNTFLMTIYIVFSLSVYETILPKLLRKIIIFFSKMSNNALYKKIKI